MACRDKIYKKALSKSRAENFVSNLPYNLRVLKAPDTYYLKLAQPTKYPISDI